MGRPGQKCRDHCGGASACGQTVYVSPANGSGWQAARHFGTGSSVDGPVAAVSSSTAYVPFTSCSGACSASRAHVEATTDGGRSWTTKALACAGQPREGSPTLSASPDGALFVVCYRSPKEGVSASAVYRSLDGGDTWQLESSFSVNERLPRGLRAGRLSVLTPTSADDAYVITDEDGGPRVEITTDGGKTWAEPASDPRVHVDGGVFATTGTSVAFLAGYGEGIWATDDGGSTWTLDPALSAAYATTAEVPQLAQLERLVRRVVDNQGKSNVTGAFVVETTDNKSDEGSSLSPSMAGDPVYVVWVEGHLQCLGCSSALQQTDPGERRTGVHHPQSDDEGRRVRDSPNNSRPSGTRADLPAPSVGLTQRALSTVALRVTKAPLRRLKRIPLRVLRMAKFPRRIARRRYIATSEERAHGLGDSATWLVRTLPARDPSATVRCTRHGLHHEAWDICENAVVGHERDPEPNRRCGHPAVGVVIPLSERMSDPLALDPQMGVAQDELRPRIHRLGSRDPRLELPHSSFTPVPQETAVTKFRGGLEGDQRWPTDDDRLVELCESGTRGPVRSHRRRCRSRLGHDPGSGSPVECSEKRQTLGLIEVFDQHLLVGRERAGATQQLLDRQLEARLARGHDGFARHLASHPTVGCRPESRTGVRPSQSI